MIIENQQDVTTAVLSELQRAPDARFKEIMSAFVRHLHELVREGEDYKVRNGLGEFFFEIRADPANGVIDMFAGPSKQEMAIFPTRVVGLPGGRSA